MEKLPGSCFRLIRHDDTYTTERARVQPVHADGLIVEDVCLDPLGFESTPSEMRLPRIAESSNRLQS